MRMRCTIMAVALVLVLCGATQAGTLYTPGLNPGVSDTLYCRAINVTTKTREVTLEIRDYLGNVVLGPNTYTLFSGSSAALNSSDDGARYCKISFKGGKKHIRASVCVYSSGHCIAAVPAF